MTPEATTHRRPIFLWTMGAFFAFGAMACLVTVVALLFPQSAFGGVWQLNPEAQAGFQLIGRPLAIALMTVVGTACALAAFGLARGLEWGRWLALAILAINLVGDLVTAVARHDPRTLIGLPIGGAMIWLLARTKMPKS